MHCCTGAPSEPCLPVVRAHGSSKPCRFPTLATTCRSHGDRHPQVRSPHGCPTCPLVSVAQMIRRSGSPASRQPAFAAGHQARYPASYTRPLDGGAESYGRAFPFPFGCWRSLLGASCSRSGFSLPCGRPTTIAEAMVDRGGVTTFHAHEMRPGRVPALPREQRCPHDLE